MGFNCAYFTAASAIKTWLFLFLKHDRTFNYSDIHFSVSALLLLLFTCGHVTPPPISMERKRSGWGRSRQDIAALRPQSWMQRLIPRRRGSGPPQRAGPCQPDVEQRGSLWGTRRSPKWSIGRLGMMSGFHFVTDVRKVLEFDLENFEWTCLLMMMMINMWWRSGLSEPPAAVTSK